MIESCRRSPPFFPLPQGVTQTEAGPPNSVQTAYPSKNPIHTHPHARVQKSRTEFIPLPPAFVQWLREDGPLVLPASVTLSSTGKEENVDGWEDEPNDQQQQQQEQQPPTEDPSAPESFSELEAALASAIEALDGAVCPKLNWSVPRDAAWVNGGTLRCETAGDVMLLLKSSDFVQHDLGRL